MRTAVLLMCLLAALASMARAGPLIPGPLETEFNSQIYRRVIRGDGGRSFMKNGTYYLNNLNLSLNQILKDGPTVSGQLNLQQADEAQIENHQGRYKALGGFFAVEKQEKYRLEGGAISPAASRATLTSTVLGLGGYAQLNGTHWQTRLTGIGGQLNPSIEGTQFLRHASGGTLTQVLKGDAGSVKFGFHGYRVADVQGSIRHYREVARYKHTAYAATTELQSRTGLGLSSELAFVKTDDGLTRGRAFSLNPYFTNELVQARAGYERNSPRFVNPYAGAAADTKRVDGSLTIGQVNQLTLNGQYSQNNTEGQLASTFKSQLTGASGRVQPFPDNEFWKGFTVASDYNINRSLSTDRTLDTESRQAGLSLVLDIPGIHTELRGENQPSRDLLNPDNDRDVYRAKWDMGIRLRNKGQLRIGPSWSLAIERTWNPKTRLTDQAGAAAGGLSVSHGETVALDLRHEFQQTVTKPSARKVRNNFSSGSLKVNFKIKKKVPVSITVAAFNKHYYDTYANAFTEQELRGTLNVRF